MLTSRLISVLAAAAALVALAPGCSSNSPATAQVGLVWAVQIGSAPGNSSATCPVPGQDAFTIGSGDPYDNPVADGSTSGGAPVSVSCKVSGNDSSGYNIFLSAQKGTGADFSGSITITGHVDGTTNAQPNISGAFNDNLAMTANLSETDCTITYPNTSDGMGIAGGRIWAHIDCPTATDGTRGRICDASANFRFENCSQ